MARRQMFVIPIKGAMVRDSRTMSLLSQDGGWVEATNYWLRRIADGTVREVQTPEPNIPVKEEPVKERNNKKEGQKHDRI